MANRKTWVTPAGVWTVAAVIFSGILSSCGGTANQETATDDTTSVDTVSLPSTVVVALPQNSTTQKQIVQGVWALAQDGSSPLYQYQAKAFKIDEKGLVLENKDLPDKGIKVTHDSGEDEIKYNPLYLMREHQVYAIEALDADKNALPISIAEEEEGETKRIDMNDTRQVATILLEAKEHEYVLLGNGNQLFDQGLKALNATDAIKVMSVAVDKFKSAKLFQFEAASYEDIDIFKDSSIAKAFTNPLAWARYVEAQTHDKRIERYTSQAGDWSTKLNDIMAQVETDENVKTILSEPEKTFGVLNSSGTDALKYLQYIAREAKADVAEDADYLKSKLGQYIHDDYKDNIQTDVSFNFDTKYQAYQTQVFAQEPKPWEQGQVDSFGTSGVQTSALCSTLDASTQTSLLNWMGYGGTGMTVQSTDVGFALYGAAGQVISTVSYTTLSVSRSCATSSGTTAQTSSNTSSSNTSSTDAPKLASLLTSTGSLSPAFSADSLIYNMSITWLTSLFTLTPTVVTSGATVKIKGVSATSGAPYSLSPLGWGSSEPVPVVVTTPDGVTSRTYTVNVAKPNLAQKVYVKASATLANANFGGSVAIDGDTMVIGAAGDLSGGASTAGAAYVYIRNNGVWTLQQRLQASNAETGDQFGSKVAISGDTIVVGASGENSNVIGVTTGTQPTAATDNDSNNNAGAAYVFERSGSIWTQVAYLKAAGSSPASAAFGGDGIGISGDRIVVGSPNVERAYVYTRSSGTWNNPMASLLGSNTTVGDLFGKSVTISGTTIVVGAEGEDSDITGVRNGESFPTNDNATNPGAAYVFVYSGSGTTWNQQALLKASNTGNNDSFGWSVAISGDTIVVGAYQEDSNSSTDQTNEGATNSGAAYVFNRSATSWSSTAYLKASNIGGADNFGSSVATSGDVIVVGAPGERTSLPGFNPTPNTLAASSGAMYIFRRVDGSWTSTPILVKSSKPESGAMADSLGESVSLSGDTVVVGARYEDSNTTGIFDASGWDAADANSSSTESGAAYVFQ